SGASLRLRVIVDGSELGHLDLRVRGTRDGSDSVWSPNGRMVSPDAALPIRFWIQRPPRRFTVLVGPGVRGDPGASDSLWTDGTPATQTGVVVTDTEHVLTVTADRHVVLGSAALPLYALARAVLTSADPIGAYQAYLDMASAYVGSSVRGAEESLRDVRDVEFLAFDPIRDSAALRRVDGALAGHVFTTDSAVSGVGSAASERMRPRGAVRGLEVAGPADTTERTVFLYVNGIATPQFGPEGALATRVALRGVVDEIPLFLDPRRFDVKLFYNRTYSEQLPTLEQQRSHCVSLFAPRFAFGYLGANSFAPFMAACMADQTYRRFADH